MSEVRYAFRVRGRNSDVVLTALQEGLDIEVAPTTTAMHGWLPDQAALFGMLARIRLLGLELLEIRRLPHGGQPVDSRGWANLRGTPERKPPIDGLDRRPTPVTEAAEKPRPARWTGRATGETPRPPDRAS